MRIIELEQNVLARRIEMLIEGLLASFLIVQKESAGAVATEVVLEVATEVCPPSVIAICLFCIVIII